MNEFKATHRYMGGDDGVFDFEEGDEVMFVRYCDPDECFGNGHANGRYVNADGLEQYVYLHCMEPI